MLTAIRAAALILWLIISSALYPLLFVSFFVPHDALLTLIPPCPDQVTTGQECTYHAILTSILWISRGRLNDAMQAHPAGIPLYAAVIWNQYLAAWYTLGELKWLWAQGRRPKPKTRAQEYSCRP